MNPGSVPSSSLPLDEFRRILEVCDRFEERLRAGEHPTVEEFLGETTGAERAALAHELASLRHEYLGAPGEDSGQGAVPPEQTIAPDPAFVTSNEFILEAQGQGDDLEILEEIGRGGMGVVYRARQTKLDRVVALKMILGDSRTSPHSIARFRTEAQAVARLSHPNFVQIHEIGERNGFPYFTMEFVEGGSLARKLKGGPLPVRQAAAMIEVLARASHEAHLKGIVHRDIKPANILLTHGGVPKITDFGLAKLETRSGPESTQGEMLVGTPAYMAPEQAGGEASEVSPLADVYSLGATLYEMLTGLPPFQAGTSLETLLLAISQEPTPPGRHRPGLPRDLETICLKCLEKDPEQRYASAEALALDLHAYLGGEPITAQPAGQVDRAIRWARNHPARVIFVACAFLALVGLLVGVWASSALAFGAMAVLGLLGGGSWYHIRLQSALRELAHQQISTERYAERLHLLGEMTRRLLSVTDLDKLLFLLSETACRVANAELATIFLIDRERKELWSRFTIDSNVGEIRFPLGVGIAGTVAVTGETIHIPDAYADPRFNPEIDKRSGYRTRNLLTFPMVGKRGLIVGVFQVINKREGRFDLMDEEVLSSLAASAALAVERSHLNLTSGPLAPLSLHESDLETKTLIDAPPANS